MVSASALTISNPLGRLQSAKADCRPAAASLSPLSIAGGAAGSPRSQAAESSRGLTVAADPTAAGCAPSEATVLLRKAAVVMLARLMTQALAQSSAFIVVMLLFLFATSIWRPYEDAKCLLAESCSLLCLIVTAAMTVAVQPAAGLSASASATLTILMLLINFGTLAYLCIVWARMCMARNIEKAKTTAAAVRKRLSLKPGQWPASPGAGAASGGVSPGSHAARLARTSSIGRLRRAVDKGRRAVAFVNAAGATSAAAAASAAAPTASGDGGPQSARERSGSDSSGSSDSDSMRGEPTSGSSTSDHDVASSAAVTPEAALRSLYSPTHRRSSVRTLSLGAALSSPAIADPAASTDTKPEADQSDFMEAEPVLPDAAAEDADTQAGHIIDSNVAGGLHYPTIAASDSLVTAIASERNHLDAHAPLPSERDHLDAHAQADISTEPTRFLYTHPVRGSDGRSEDWNRGKGSSSCSRLRATGGFSTGRGHSSGINSSTLGSWQS